MLFEQQKEIQLSIKDRENSEILRKTWKSKDKKHSDRKLNLILDMFVFCVNIFEKINTQKWLKNEIVIFRKYKV